MAIQGGREGRERLLKLATELPIYRGGGETATTADELLAQYRRRNNTKNNHQRRLGKPSGGHKLGGGRGNNKPRRQQDEQQMFAEIFGSPRGARGGGGARRGGRPRAWGAKPAAAAGSRGRSNNNKRSGGTVAQLAIRLKALEQEHRDLRRQDALRTAELEKLENRRAAGREARAAFCDARDRVLAEAAAKENAAANGGGGNGLMSADDDALMDAIAPSTPNMKTGRGYSAGERALLRALAQSPGAAGGEGGEGGGGGIGSDGEAHVATPPASPATVRAAAAAGLRAAHAMIAGRRLENAGLRAQIRDIHAFLKRHGLAWTGGRGDGGGGAGSGGAGGGGSNAGAAADAGKGAADESDDGSGGGDSIDVGDLFTKLGDLSAAASSRVAKAGADGTFDFGGAAGGGGGRARARTSLFDRGARAVTAASVPLTVYRDGLFLWRGPFRPFAAAAARAFVRDVLAGYCPAEFRARGGRFAHGVVFAPLTDRTHETFAAAEARVHAQEAAMGPAARAAAARRARMVVVGGDRGGNRGGNRGGGDDQLRALGVDELLRRVPKTRVAGGEIVELREKMAALLRRRGKG